MGHAPGCTVGAASPTGAGSLSIVNDPGNPRGKISDPHPYPSKPVPVPHGYGFMRVWVGVHENRKPEGQGTCDGGRD